MKYTYRVMQDCFTNLTGDPDESSVFHHKDAIIHRQVPMDEAAESHLLAPVNEAAKTAFTKTLESTDYNFDSIDLGILMSHLENGAVDIAEVHAYLAENGVKYKGDNVTKLCKHVQAIQARKEETKFVKPNDVEV